MLESVGFTDGSNPTRYKYLHEVNEMDKEEDDDSDLCVKRRHKVIYKYVFSLLYLAFFLFLFCM